eukprot:TRINITY_DN5586_c0_g1_i1.p1 TRINITY_DN5586_c0_g1~~TRINITY_DN5586_c0_g1_i1.p1  ORF type:complete len:233 (-),score=50.53 TRINITY_DN5586_c0_g1_i1:148-846(-)
MIPVHDKFRVIALGLPVPRFIGHPLDPPLRSRFQARDIPPPSIESQYQILRTRFPGLDQKIIQSIITLAESLKQIENAGHDAMGSLPHFPETALISLAHVAHMFPAISMFELFVRAFPYQLVVSEVVHDSVSSVLKTWAEKYSVGNRVYNFERIFPAASSTGKIWKAQFTYATESEEESVYELEVPHLHLKHESHLEVNQVLNSKYFLPTLSKMVQDHCAGLDICLVSEIIY